MITGGTEQLINLLANDTPLQLPIIITFDGAGMLNLANLVHLWKIHST